MKIFSEDVLVFRLRITSWVKTLGYAKHYYGKIEHRSNHVNIEVELYFSLDTEGKLKSVNDEGDPEEIRYKLGEGTSRFPSLISLLEEAQRVMNELAPGHVLIDSVGTGKVLCGPEKIKNKLNPINKKLEEAEERGDSESELEAIDDMWWMAFRKLHLS